MSLIFRFMYVKQGNIRNERCYQRTMPKLYGGTSWFKVIQRQN